MRTNTEKPSDPNSGLLQPWVGKAILLVDLDAFFASVEQLDHPAWRGKPVIVGGHADKRGVVAAASYEARVFGVRSAMPSVTAKMLCPDAIWTHGHYSRYKEVSNKVMQVIYLESPFVQQVSIDEAFVDISPTPHNTEHPVDIAKRIQENIEKLGVTCSIGIGTSKTIAKIASDMDKPRGLTVVYPGREKDFLAPLPVRCLSGVGAAAEAELYSHSIETMGDLAAADLAFLERLFGKNGKIMHIRANGKDNSPIITDEPAKSVSNELSFSEDLTTTQEVEAAISTMAAKVGRRLRTKGLKGQTLSLKVRYDDRSIKTLNRRLNEPTNDELAFTPLLLALLKDIWKPGMPVRLIGVGMSGFEESAEKQGKLFDFNDDQTPEEEIQPLLPDAEKRAKLLQAKDRLRDKFGEDAVRFGHEIQTYGLTTGTGAKNPTDYK